MGLLAGVVRTTDRQPIPDARVLVVSGPSHHDIAALTNAKGHFRMGGLEPGKYRIEVIADGYLPVQGSVRVLAKGTRLYRIALEAIDLDNDDDSVPEMD